MELLVLCPCSCCKRANGNDNWFAVGKTNTDDLPRYLLTGSSVGYCPSHVQASWAFKSRQTQNNFMFRQQGNGVQLQQLNTAW